MQIETKDDLLKVIEDLASRLALVEEADFKAEPEEQNDKEAETPTGSESETAEYVESEDEIEKLLNS